MFASADGTFAKVNGTLSSADAAFAAADALFASPRSTALSPWTEAVDPRGDRDHPPRVPQRKNYLFVCVNSRPDGTPKGSCAARGSIEIHAALKLGLATRGLAKLEARACTASCLDACWAGPIVAVEPAGYFYGHVTLADVPAILDALASGTRVERLVLPASDFDEATARPPLPVKS
jgi:(2Fe-2S) ferredoxin